VGDAERHPRCQSATEEDEGRSVADGHRDEPDPALQSGARAQAEGAGDLTEDGQGQPQPTHSLASVSAVADSSGLPTSTRMTPMMMSTMPVIAPRPSPSPKNTRPSIATSATALAAQVAYTARSGIAIRCASRGMKNATAEKATTPGTQVVSTTEARSIRVTASSASMAAMSSSSLDGFTPPPPSLRHR